MNAPLKHGSAYWDPTYSHSAAFLDDGTGKPSLDEKGTPIILCICAPTPEHKALGNWDVLGLNASGSIDDGAEDVFIAEAMVFPILTTAPSRQKEFFSLDVVAPAAIGHSGWAIGASRRMLGESEKFWFDFGRAEARVRAARAFLFEVWCDVKASIEAGQAVSTRQISLVHLAESEVHEAWAEACNFAGRAAGGASLRRGVMRRVCREMMTAVQRLAIAPAIVTSAGRELGGIWSDRAWQLYDLIEQK